MISSGNGCCGTRIPVTEGTAASQLTGRRNVNFAATALSSMERDLGGVSLLSQMTEAGPRKLLTLAFVPKDGKLMLGMKKRGFGEGYYNGFGGKVEEGETIEEAAARELHEEAGIIPLEMSKRGIITYVFDDRPVPWEVHVFQVSAFSGEPCETEEMAPIWFTVSEIPYEKMWKDDSLWIPLLLKGTQFRAEFHFQNSYTLVAQRVQVVPAL